MKMEVRNRPHNRYDMDMGKDMLNVKGVSVWWCFYYYATLKQHLILSLYIG